MRRLAFLLLLVLLTILLSGCRSKTVVTRLGPPGVEHRAVPQDSVFQFLGKDRVLVAYEPIAHLEFKANYNLSGLEDEEEVEERLLMKAGQLGAHGIVWTSFTEATAIRFTHGEVQAPVPDKAAIKAAVDSGILNPVRPEPVRFFPSGPDPWLHAARHPRDVRTLGVASVALPQDLPVPDSVVAIFTETLYAELQAAGYDVYPLEGSGSDAPNSKAPNSKAPDPKAPDPGKAGTDSQPAGADSFAVEAGPPFDAVLYPDIIPVEAHFYGDRADWDGVSRKVGETRSTGARILSGILTAIVHGEHGRHDDFAESDEPEGWVWAISLEVTMENSIGALVYSGRGGIELLEKADFEGGIYIGDPGPEDYEIEDVAEEQLFTRTGRWTRAVGIALAGLRGGGYRE